MKIVAVVLGIITILFLSEQAEISVRFSETKFVIISFRLFSLELSLGKNSSKSPPMYLINPVITAFRFLLTNSSMKVVLTRGFSSITRRANTIVTLSSAAIFTALLRYITQNGECIILSDPIHTEDRYEINCESQVIIFIISLILFVWKILVYKIRRSVNYARRQT